ncbi:MAG TPA: flagellar hook-basal body complex protein [Candidatus Sulfotelmatobacter sp.]|jgi:flagellar hook protein FlgE|nr:flagellar hook-basal body complex protein [Candidatus Sulfotelmatobacter sp.]
MDAAMNAAVSALKSESQALSTISTNLANSGTTGYKAVSTQFLNLLNGTTSGTSGTQSGGVTTVTRQNVSLTGNITSTTNSTDMAIDGTGFFVVSDGTNDYYTRNGSFTSDSTGNLYLSGTSYYLMGWTTDATGSVTTVNQGNTASLEKINVQKYNSTATATTTYSMSANLPDEAQSDVNTLSYTNDSGSSETLNYAWTSTGTNSSGNSTYLVSVTPSNSSVTLDDGTTSGVSQLTYTVEADSSGNIVSVTGTTNNTTGYSGTELPSSITASDKTSGSIDTSTETWSAVEAKTGFSKSTSMKIYDSLGTEESVPVTWTAAGDNTWVMTVSSPTDASGSTTSGLLSDSSGVSASSYSYSVSFNSDGTLKSITPLSEMNGSTVSTAPVDANGDPIIKTYSWTDGATAGTVTLNLGTVGKSDGLTQYDTGETTPSISVKSTTQDGVQYGTLKSVAVNSSGEIVATYSNGESVPIYKVAVATFANANGLAAKSDTVYQQTSSSGGYILNEAGQNGAGSLEGSSLESSTVDTSTEFSNMITCQQAYSAASQIISTGKSMFTSLLQAVQ